MVVFADKDLLLLRQILKNNVINDKQFYGYKEERRIVLELVKQTIELGESNSVLLIGAKSSGKTTLVNGVLQELGHLFKSDAVLVKLNGLIHTDDRLALKTITTQLELDNAVDGKVFGSFADNLSFLLACLGSGAKDSSKSVIFVIEEFDLICLHHNQTLLYNLFDISQSAQTPVCVLGISNRLDVTELLEKRVKSRFSHRQIFLYPEREREKEKQCGISEVEHALERIKGLLTVSKSTKQAHHSKVIREWNKHVSLFVKNEAFKKLIDQLVFLDTSERVLKNILVTVVSQLDDKNCLLTLEKFAKQIEMLGEDKGVQLMQDLNVLELCLLIAMKHHCEIYDNQAMNFEMVFTRYVKFVNAHSNMQTVQKPVIMKAFEHIENLGLVSMLSAGNSKVQKEYKLFKFLLMPWQVLTAVQKSPGLPTEVVQWANSSLV